MFLVSRRLIVSAVSLLLVQSSFGCLQDLAIDKSIDFLVSQTPEQAAEVISRIPELIQDKLKIALLKKYTNFYCTILPEQLGELKGHTDSVTSVAFSSDGELVVTGSYDKTARLWNVDTLKSRELKGHTACVSSVAFSPDGMLVLTGSYDDTARLWNLATLKSTVLKGHKRWITAVAFSPDGKLALIGSHDCTARLWDLATLESTELKGHTRYITSVAFSPDGKLALTGSHDCTARIWNLNTLKSQELKGHTEGVSSVAFSPDGKLALTGSKDYTARLWDVDTLESRELEGYTGGVVAVTFSPNDKLVVTCSSDYTAHIWNIDKLKSQELKGHASYVSSVAFSPDGKLALTGSGDTTARIWILATTDTVNLEQLLFIHSFGHNNIDLDSTFNQELLESLAPVIDGLPKLPSQSYYSNLLVKAYLDVKRTELLKAAAHDDVATVEKLLSRGFGLNTCDKAGNNLWHYAFKGHIKDGKSCASEKVIELLMSLEGINKGLKKNNKAGLPPFAVGLVYNKEFTAQFIAEQSKVSQVQHFGDYSLSLSRCAIQ